MRSRAEQILESWKEAEKYHQEIAQKNDPLSHQMNKILHQHLGLANGKDKKVRGRAKAVLRHFVKWQDAEATFRDKHKKMPTMDDLAAQKPKSLKAWLHYKRNVHPKEKRYHKETWLLNQESDTASKGKKGK